MTELGTEAFGKAHPVLQAAFAHHALAAVHPFADGNGRVARTLSSVHLLRAASIPLFVFNDQKVEYFDALEAADAGRFEAFARFVFERGLDTLGLANDWARAEDATDDDVTPSRQETLRERVRSLLRPAVDDAVAQRASRGNVVIEVHDQPDRIDIHARRGSSRTLEERIQVHVDAVLAGDRALRVTRLDGGDDTLEVRLSDIDPVVTASAKARVRAWVAKVVAELARETLRPT